jgi:serine/threonine protein phosphatase PrpC
MGNPYLSKPKTEKEHKTFENDKIRYVASGMQGWRTGMEDAHISYDNLGDGNALFGVFDGHGGA